MQLLVGAGHVNHRSRGEFCDVLLELKLPVRSPFHRNHDNANNVVYDLKTATTSTEEIKHIFQYDATAAATSWADWSVHTCSNCRMVHFSTSHGS